MCGMSILNTWKLAVWASLILFGLVLCAQTSLAQDVTIKGRFFYKNDAQWLPKGIDVEAFNEPPQLRAKNALAMQARSYWGDAELGAAKKVFGINTIRLTVSQPGLDPQSPIYDPKYLPEILEAVQLARSLGFVVLVAVDAQPENGIPDLPCMPDDSTVRAWRSLAPPLARDRDVMFELFNEPCKSNNAEGQQEWAQSMQKLVTELRELKATNVLLLDGLWSGRSTNGLFPLIHDPLSDRLALAVHPYLARGAFVTERHWHNQFGDSAARYPAIVTEWNATPTNGCVDNTTPALVTSLMRYIESLQIGLVAWAIDSSHGKLVKDRNSYQPTDYASFKDCKDGSESGGGLALANFPHD
jgi:endoglucanase